jgi:ATP-dependent exoDNAse (exonuclease V) beta subunit
MADRDRYDATHTQRWAARQPSFRHFRRYPAAAKVQRTPTSRWTAAVDERPRFQPKLRSVPSRSTQEFWDHRGTTSDRAFGRTVHAVLHQALLEMQTDPVSQKLHERMGQGPAAQRTETERKLIEHEMQRASRLLARVWGTENDNFPHEPDAWRSRAADYIGRYVSSDDYLRAKVWHYPIKGSGGVTTDVPMLEFPFRVRTRTGVELVGRFDRVDDRNGRPVVIDYKTGPPRSMTALRHDHQMLLYAAAIADLTGAKTVVTEIHWLSTGTKSTLTFSGSELRRARDEAAKYVRQVERHALFGTPSPEPHVPDPMPRAPRVPSGGGLGAA